MENPQEQLHERIEISREADTVSAFLAVLSIGSESPLSFLPYIQLCIVFRAPQSLQLPKTHSAGGPLGKSSQTHINTSLPAAPGQHQGAAATN